MVPFSSVHIIDQVVPGRGKVEPFVSILSPKEGCTEVFLYLTYYSLQCLFDLMLSIANSTWKMHHLIFFLQGKESDVHHPKNAKLQIK